MNVSIISLSATHLTNSPFLSFSSLYGHHKLSIFKSNFYKFSSSAIFDRGKRFTYEVKGSFFQKFLSTSIAIYSEHLEGLEGNETFTFKEKMDFTATDCVWMNCCVKKGGSAIVCLASHAPLCTLELERCRFIICISKDFGAIYFTGSRAKIVNSCFESCVAKYKFQSFYLWVNDGNCTVESCHKNSCSGLKPIGGSYTEHLHGNICVLTNCNHTKNYVKLRRVLGSVGLNNYIKYQRNIFVNNSGTTFFGFSTVRTTDYIISDCILSRCYCKSDAKGFVETNNKIIFRRFQLYQTKMLFHVVDDVSADEDKNSRALFIDCITDSKPQSIITTGLDVSVVNLSYVKKRTYDLHFDYLNWKCRSPIQQLPKKTPPETPKRTPKRTPVPTISPFVFKFENSDKEPELVDMYGKEDNATDKSYHLDVVILIFLLIVSIALFIIGYWKKERGAFNNEEKETFLKK